MKNLAIVTSLFLILGFSCKENISKPNLTPSEIKAQKIIDKAIEAHGGEKYDDLKIEFDFRNRHYKAERKDDFFKYERIFKDTADQKFHDILTNDGFTRTINEELADVTEKKQSAYSNSINSVIYFALLPYFLNDPAVMKNYAGEEKIKDLYYHKVKVTFKQEGGGKDFEDVFMYWINKETFTMDYLAYNYLTDGGGARFRKAYNTRSINGLRFADYENYKPNEKTRDIDKFGQLFQNEELKLLSKIESKNIKVH